MTAIASTKPEQDRTYRSSVCVDAGNRYLKWVNSHGVIQLIPAVVKELEDYDDVTIDDERTVLIEIHDRRFLIGEGAKHQNGFSVFSESKTELAWLLALVAMEPMPTESEVTIETLRYAIPDVRNPESITYLQRLEAIHTFKRNDHPVIAKVRKVEAWDENQAAYRYAVSKGLFQYHNLTNGIISCGGGTFNCSLFSPKGSSIREHDVVIPGTFSLAEKISASLMPVLGFRAEPALIMDAIERGDYRYGHPTKGTYFEPQFLKALEATITEVRQKIKTAWVKPLSGNTIGEVLIVGGSAPLFERLEALTGGRFKIARDDRQPNFAQFLSLQGMLLGGKR